MSLALGVFAGRVAKEVIFLYSIILISKTYGGSIMSTFGAIGNISRLLSDVFVFSFVHYLGWQNVALLTLVGTFGYAVYFIKGLNSFEKKSFKT